MDKGSKKVRQIPRIEERRSTLSFEDIGHVKKNCLHHKSKDNEDDHVCNVITITDYRDLLTIFKDKIVYSHN